MTACLLAPLALAVLPAQEAYAETAGEDLVIRVGYFGDDKDYREKAVITRADMELLAQEEGSVIYNYSNVTRVGTVMGTIARGPTVAGVLEAAGIDYSSVQTLNLRTTDGTKVNNWFVSLNMDQWVRADRYYYPYLRGNYERVEDEEGMEDYETGMITGAVRPGTGALRGRAPVPAILAIESFTTKDPGEVIDETMMDESASYRFCAGQTLMTEGTDCRDYSSMNSAMWIFGIDVTLSGKPADATGLDLTTPDPKSLVVGSKAQMGYRIYGQELFDDKVSGKLKWKSSNPSVAKVSANGVVTILKAGTVTITATTPNGISKSVTIKCRSGKSPKKPEKEDKPEKNEPEKKPEKIKKAVDQTAAAPQSPAITQTRPASSPGLNQPGQINRPEQQRQTEKEKEPEEKTRNNQKKEQKQKAPDPKPEEEKKIHSSLHEIELEGMVSDREEMEAGVTPLDAQKRSPAAGAIALGGTGLFAAAGGLVRFFGYLKEVR